VAHGRLLPKYGTAEERPHPERTTDHRSEAGSLATLVLAWVAAGMTIVTNGAVLTSS
jgi:hypothetical protein